MLLGSSKKNPFKETTMNSDMEKFSDTEQPPSDRGTHETLNEKLKFLLEMQKCEEDCVRELESRASSDARNLVGIAGLSGILSLTRIPTSSRFDIFFVLISLVFLMFAAGIGCFHLSKVKTFRIIDLSSLEPLIYGNGEIKGDGVSVEDLYYNVFQKRYQQLEDRELVSNQQMTYIYWGYFAYLIALIAFAVPFVIGHISIVLH
jgi:hypothetical protein